MLAIPVAQGLVGLQLESIYFSLPHLPESSVLNEAWSRFGQGDLALKELRGQAQSGRWVGKAGV